MRRWRPNGPAALRQALAHGWWKGWRAPKSLSDESRDRGPRINVLSVIGFLASDAASFVTDPYDRLPNPLESSGTREYGPGHRSLGPQ